MSNTQYFSPAFIKQVASKLQRKSENQNYKTEKIYIKKSYSEMRDAFIRASKKLTDSLQNG